MRQSLYSVGGICFAVTGETLYPSVENLPGFKVFAAETEEKPDFLIIERQNLTSDYKKIMLYEGEADGVKFSLFTLESGGYFLYMHRIRDNSTLCLKSTHEKELLMEGDFCPQMLRFTLWIGYGLMCSAQGRIAVHGSSVVKDGKAYLFLGESGTGKSTHSRLWADNIPGTSLLNDDSPIVALENNAVFLYGSPWSGKTPCYRQDMFPLGGCVRLSQAKENRITRLSKIRAYAAFHPSCPPEFAKDRKLYENECKTIDRVIGDVPFFHLECRPDKEAAILCFDALSSEKEI